MKSDFKNSFLFLESWNCLKEKKTGKVKDFKSKILFLVL